MKCVLTVLSALSFIFFCPSRACAQQRAIYFHGDASTEASSERVLVALENNSPVNVSHDFTLEAWIRCEARNNQGHVYAADHGDGWTRGNILADRDVFGNADPGDFGLSIGHAPGLPGGVRVLAFGISQRGRGITITGRTHVADGEWHHIAVTRESVSGEIKLFVDGQADASGKGPAGEIHYEPSRSASHAPANGFLVLGAEKHDTAAGALAYRGWMDEFRLSETVRYAREFRPPTQPFLPDAQTRLLLHFDEGEEELQSDAFERLPAARARVTPGPVYEEISPFTDNSFIKPSRATERPTAIGSSPGRVQLYQDGDQLVIRNCPALKSMVIWSGEGRRLGERRAQSAGTLRVPLGNARGVIFIHLVPEQGLPYTTKLALQ